MIPTHNLPPAQRNLTYRLNRLTFHEACLRWLRHLCERLGLENMLALWQRAFTSADDLPA